MRLTKVHTYPRSHRVNWHIIIRIWITLVRNEIRVWHLYHSTALVEAVKCLVSSNVKGYCGKVPYQKTSAKVVYPCIQCSAVHSANSLWRVNTVSGQNFQTGCWNDWCSNNNYSEQLLPKSNPHSYFSPFNQIHSPPSAVNMKYCLFT